jgi:NAD(P)-dependent dehydrogenase (short-subunit alcohol dehydrogenase family)
VHFAREGAELAISDICHDIATVPYELSAENDLSETVKLCEAGGAKVISAVVDVRDYQQVERFANRALDEYGKIDILVANAGIFGAVPIAEQNPETFGDMIDVNLKGVFHTIRAILPQHDRA